jgi:hypothetical protein
VSTDAEWADINEALEAAISEAGTARAFAEKTGYSEAYISQVRNGHKPIPLPLAMFLGFKRVTRWERVKRC